jgi:hypothetical protein
MPVRSTLIFAPCLVVVGLFAACNRQGEGEVCDPRANNNGNNDCTSNLTCQLIGGVPPTRCCPSDLARATAPACGANHAVVDANTAPPDSSPDAEGGGADIALESSVEASLDAAVEAASPDSPAQGDSNATFEAMADAVEAGPGADGGD